MEVQVGLGRVYARSPGRTFRGAFQSLFQSVRGAFQNSGPVGSREEPGPSQQQQQAAASASSSGPCASGARLQPASPRRQPGSPSFLPLDEHSPAGKALPPEDGREPHSAAAAASSSSAAAAPPPLALLGAAFQTCPGDFKDLLGEGSLLPPAEGEPRGAGEAPPSKEDYLGESAKELCKAVSASMGLAVEALDAAVGGELAAPRGDCMFALPGLHARPLASGGCKIVEAEPEGEGALALDVPAPLSLYKPELGEPSAAAAFQSRDYYNFQRALASSHGRIKLEGPLEYAAGGVWGAQCRRPGEMPTLAPHYAAPPGPAWHPFFADDGQIYGPCNPAPDGAAPGPFAYGRSPAPAGQDGGDIPAELWYPGGVVGRVPFVPAPGCIKTEITPWMEGYAGAYGDMR